MAKSGEQAAQLSLALLEDLFGSSSRYNFAVRLWDGTTWKPELASAEPTRCAR
jgi:hypothetical protein